MAVTCAEKYHEHPFKVTGLTMHAETKPVLITK